MRNEIARWRETRCLAGNLSELKLTLSEVNGAVGDAEQSVIYADRSGEAFERLKQRAKLADALHQAGRQAEAEARFREAEQMQDENQPDYPRSTRCKDSSIPTCSSPPPSAPRGRRR